LTLDSVIDVLARHQQRATFSAVAELLGVEPKSLFDGYPRRSRRTSWVVSRKTGRPTGQDNTDVDPDLLKNPHIISDSTELKVWLESHQ
jgi:hypothetical protein